MAERPRVGLERIALQRSLGEVELATRRFRAYEGMDVLVYTQRVFLVSPDGSALAYAADRDRLRVRGPGGVRVLDRAVDRDFRFSADSRHLAFLQGTAAEVDVAVLDLASGEERKLGRVGRPMWMEWVRDGVVVSHLDARDRRILSYFPLAGDARELASRENLLDRFTAAARGTRVLFFADKTIFSVDVEQGPPVAVGQLPDSVWNAEMAPGGSEAAFTTHDGLYRWRPGAVERVADGRFHTVWYSADGRSLAFAGKDEAVLLAGGRRHVLPASPSTIKALRFRRGGDGVLVVRGQSALLWRPLAGQLSTLAEVEPGQTLEGVDFYQGGTVLWTRRDDAPRKTAERRSEERADKRARL